MATMLKRSSRENNSNLIDRLRQQIITGELPAGFALPSSEELARNNSASAITVNRIMAKLADEGLVNRVKGKGTFVAERFVAVKKTCKIGLAFYFPPGDMADVSAAFAVFQDTAANYAREMGHEVKYLSYENLTSPDAVEKHLSGLDAIILSACCFDPLTLRHLKNAGTNVIVIQQTEPLDLPFHQITPNLYCGFEKALELLRRKGHERIVLATATNHTQRSNLLINCAINSGWKRENIIEVMEEPVIADLGRMTGGKLGRRILAETDCRAIMTVSDFFAFGIVDAILEKGLQLGQDVELISFDNLEGEKLYPFGYPMLTSITFPKKEITRLAVDLALRLWENPEPNLYAIRVPTELIIRQSCHL